MPPARPARPRGLHGLLAGATAITLGLSGWSTNHDAEAGGGIAATVGAHLHAMP
ncbi:hypothetical protein [Kitasatospora sp. NPDC056181]|uniref:hypothetical protein n=1 Tax=Kitasatospora sp. NPDC056181 TaxID=3345737 RepID=UPI0035E0A7BE